MSERRQGLGVFVSVLVLILAALSGLLVAPTPLG
jgi:hypothetical protein